MVRVTVQYITVCAVNRKGLTPDKMKMTIRNVGRSGECVDQDEDLGTVVLIYRDKILGCSHSCPSHKRRGGGCVLDIDSQPS
jgi:hypothetical protein